MTELKMKQMAQVYNLKKHLYDATIELVEEGYSDIEIKAYFRAVVADANEFVEEYWSL